MENLQKARTLLVGGSPIFRRGLASIVASEPWLVVCGEAGDTSRARQLCVEREPDLIVLDLELPDGDALALLRDFTQLRPSAPILVLSERGDSQWLQRIFQAGASGYVSKQDPTPEVSSGLCRLLQGGRFVSRSMSLHLVELFTTKKRKLSANGIDALSNREISVFRLIGTGLGPTAIASKLGITVKTVETHRERIKVKLTSGSGEDLKRRATEWVISTASTISGIMSLLLLFASSWISPLGELVEIFA